MRRYSERCAFAIVVTRPVTGGKSTCGQAPEHDNEVKTHKGEERRFLWAVRFTGRILQLSVSE